MPHSALDVVHLFRVSCVDHDPLIFAGSDFGDSVAAVFQNTRAEKDGALIVDTATGDRVKRSGLRDAHCGRTRPLSPSMPDLLQTGCLGSGLRLRQREAGRSTA